MFDVSGSPNLKMNMFFDKDGSKKAISPQKRAKRILEVMKSTITGKFTG